MYRASVIVFTCMCYRPLQIVSLLALIFFLEIRALPHRISFFLFTNYLRNSCGKCEYYKSYVKQPTCLLPPKAIGNTGLHASFNVLVYTGG
jgi:hypothetical protein